MSSPSSTTTTPTSNPTSNPTSSNIITTAASRLASISSYMSTPRPPVTCHVLDTSTGKPASGISCTLSRFLKLADGTPSSSSFEVARAVTNEDGRVAQWELRQKGAAARLDVEEGFTYKIRFDTWDHFGGETFFPYVEVVFTVKDATQHYHIPLLLAPYSYTTYRGS